MADDPRDATFWANEAALKFARENTLGEDVKGRAQTEAKYKYERGELERAEPRALKANTNKANTEGLLQSGILADRQGQTQAGYVGKEGRLAEGRKTAIERYNEADTRANAKYGLDYNRELTAAGERYKKNLIENPPPEPTYPGQSFPTPPGTYGTPGPGGVTPYEAPGVTVGRTRGPSPRELEAQRAAAARKAAGRKARVG